ncbi:DUF4974 domain-containing protein [bacterium]|nr:MAG: DUF4974 domain-containing protein [bacterium]
MKEVDIHKLVQDLGSSLDNQKRFHFDSESGLEALNAYKQESQNQAKQPNSDKLWAAIEQSTKAPQKASVRSVKPMYWMAIAAAILVAAFVFVMQLSTDNQLDAKKILAETSAEMQSVSIEGEASVTLRNFGQLALLENSDKTYKVGLNGEAKFEVDKRNIQTFQVETAQGLVTVLGTRFYVLATDSLTRVYLEEGSVQVEIPSLNQTRKMVPGEVLVFTNKTIIEHSRRDAEAYSAWMNNEMVLNARSAEDVLDEIERHFKIEVHRPRQIQKERLTGTVVLKSLPSVLHDLELVLGGTFERKNETTYNWILSD